MRSDRALLPLRKSIEDRIEYKKQKQKYMNTGAYKHKLYKSWCDMRLRCLNPRHKNYRYYGGRGITVCKEWDNFWTFVNAVGQRPTKSHSLDRIDNNKGYYKENVRWATKREQCLNRRKSETCRAGHKWEKENTAIWKKGNSTIRSCKICRAEYRRKNPRPSRAKQALSKLKEKWGEV